MATTATEADTGRTLSGHDEAAEHIARQAFADAQAVPWVWSWNLIPSS
ncbi:Glutamate--cysteine ligase GshA [Mycobacteroides abscessus]|nr:Glutamate--cysteine ligase GshA [Mycobacteroides abscessus]CQA07989.1 Glutamate--cysteine ligase GshA [Mycobacteroides abscessus]